MRLVDVRDLEFARRVFHSLLLVLNDHVVESIAGNFRDFLDRHVRMHELIEELFRRFDHGADDVFSGFGGGHNDVGVVDCHNYCPLPLRPSARVFLDNDR